ncbi:lantibiotic dehydratase [Streptomyces sp. LZ34]
MTPMYRHTGVALLRSASVPLTRAPDVWPDPSDVTACRIWLREVWARPGIADAVRQASPSLAARVDDILAGRSVRDRQVRRATTALVGYVLRGTGRPTPFGLFAGVAPVTLGSDALIRWGDGHLPVARADAQWLADVIGRLEACPELLGRLDVVFNDLAVRRGSRLEVPRGRNRTTMRRTPPVQAVWDAAAAPVRFSSLVEKVADAFPSAEPAKVRSLLTRLVRHGFLLTSLRAPFTATDPLAHLLGRLHTAGADAVASVAPLLGQLEAVHADVERHNQGGLGATDRLGLRGALTREMREVSEAGPTPLAVDLRLDCGIQVPEGVAEEMERAAGALLRLTRQHTGRPEWREYHAAFVDRYGTDTLVPLRDVVDPDAGLGYPAGYPGSVLPEAVVEDAGDRDQRLLALAWQAVTDGSHEIVLTEETIEGLAGDEPLPPRRVPPHVELSARVHAADVDALGRGEFTLVVAPARAAGTLTARFTPAVPDSGLEDVYGAVPTATAGALPVQLSCPPVSVDAENVCRVPAYLPHVLSLGEHRGPRPAAPGRRDGRASREDPDVFTVDDLAVTATWDCLHLVSMAHRRIIEPQVFHPLALDHQLPPTARFIARLPRAFTAAWHEFDWGPHAARLPYLPRVRHGRSVLSPARWHLTRADVPGEEADDGQWQHALTRWRARWRCPAVSELRDADRALRLDLDKPAHGAVLRAHLRRFPHATLTETAISADAYGWAGGHVHEIVLPLFRRHGCSPSPLTGPLPVVVNPRHGDLPGSPGARWLYVKVYAHPERQDEIVADALPRLVAGLEGDPLWWFVRYRGSHDTDHLRVRIRTAQGRFGAYAGAVGSWADDLRERGLAGHIVFDTYRPETGRYGAGESIVAAEAVFAADTSVVAAELRGLPPAVIAPVARVALNMVEIAEGLLGSPDEAMRWLAARPAPAGKVVQRAVADQVIQGRARMGDAEDRDFRSVEVTKARQARAAALARYRGLLPDSADMGAVLESLLHMHHNRALGMDRAQERACRRLARQAALAWCARQAEGGGG